MPKSFSIKKQILLIFLTTAFLPMAIINILSITFTKYQLMSSEVHSQTQIMNLTSAGILHKLTYFNTLTKSIYYNEDIMNYLEKSAREQPLVSERTKIKSSVDAMMRTDDNILAMHLLTFSGEELFWNDGYSNTVSTQSISDDFIDVIYAANGSGVFSSPILSGNTRRYPRTAGTLMYGRLIKSLSDHFKPLGILIIAVDVTCFNDIIRVSGFSSSANILLVNDHSDILWSYSNSDFPYRIGDKATDEIFASTENSYTEISVFGESYYRFHSHVDEYGYICYSFLPKSVITEKYTFLYINSICMIIAIFFCLLTVYKRIVRHFIRPIQKLSIMMNEQKYTEITPFTYNIILPNEIEYLYQSFHHLNNRTYELVDQLKKSAETVNLQQLKLLRAQLNPHFLYNTLDTVSWMAQNGQQKKIPEIIHSLSHILRYSIKNYTEFVPLQEELHWLKSYLHIQTYRFHSLFDITYHIDDNSTLCYVPRFILQPFIENSIIHGFSDMHTGGQIILSVYQNRSSLFIEIEDNGKGINPLAIQSILYGKRNGIGISNIHIFLEQRFGTPYGIQIFSSPNAGTRIVARLPLLSNSP